jgi:3-deoxy-D-manno-octulosonate 8-phosphate phosphatase (KDO 8-P phosphatase)
MQKNFKQLLNDVSTFAFDVDGVLTDGSLILMPDGEQVRTMNIRDGYAIQLAVKKGYKVVIISGGKSEAVRTRLTKLGVKDIYLGIQDKADTLDEFLLTYNIKPENVLYMGDDMPDYEVMKKVGIRTCPNDAVSEIRSMCIYVSDKKGGKGCARDIIEQVLKVQGKWE